MRANLTILLLLVYTIAFAQPSNDDCVNASVLTLSAPAPCPNTSPVTDNFSLTNVDATPASPYPAFTGCDIGGDTDSPAAEVWYAFQATANVMDFSITGSLSTPNAVLYTGTDCDFLNAVYCASADAGGGNLAFSFNTVQGQFYYLMISGGDVDDQGAFNLTTASHNDCNPCLNGSNFIASPPPTNGTYSSNQMVTFCYTVTNWDVTGTIEWLHALEITMGPGWDMSTLSPSPPPSCDGQGSWNWYESWTSSNSGQSWGPGFAYDSGSGGPLDGNPGNNWGDGGNGCANIGTSSSPVTFCWSVRVGNCPPNDTGSDLALSVNVLSDGDSGSWTATGCNSGSEYDFFASAICCNDLDPMVITTPTSCPGTPDGSVTMLGGGGIDPSEVYDFTLFNPAGNVIATCIACTGSAVFDNLPAGGPYAVQVTNIAAACNRSATFNIDDTLAPEGDADNDAACDGDPFSLFATPDPGPFINYTYSWSGPGGYSSNQQNPNDATLAGTYTVTISGDGCAAAPISTVAAFDVISIILDPLDPACAGSDLTLSVLGDPTYTYTWEDLNTGDLYFGSPTTFPAPDANTTFDLTVINENGCTRTELLPLEVLESPTVEVFPATLLCEDLEIQLTASGADFYLWEDGTTGPDFTSNFTAGWHSVSVTGTTQGCSTTFVYDFFVNPEVTPSISPSDPVICPGEFVTLTASGGAIYNWVDGPSDSSTYTVIPTETDTFTVIVENLDGCSAEASVIVIVDDPLEAPVVTCGAQTPTSIAFQWGPVANATDYNVDVLSGETGTLNGTTFSVDGLVPGTMVTIAVQAVGNTTCEGLIDTITCSSQECPPVGIAITPVNDICLDGTIDSLYLEATISPTMDGDTLWSGPGIVDSLAGIFMPDSAGVGTHEIILTYMEDICPYKDTIEINVFEVPTPNFDISDTEICILDQLTAVYTGTADSLVTYNWDFDGATADTATGPGPILLEWSSAGTKTISLSVEENGCLSEVFSLNVDVSEEISAPVISCGATTTTSVIFNWNDVVGASGYTVDVLTGQTGMESGTSITFDNLAPGEQVEIEVTALNPTPCPDVSASFTCEADPCQDFIFNFTPVDDICRDASTLPFDLMATVTGGYGTGTYTWIGGAITDAAAGTFDPLSAQIGANTVTLTYTEGPCSESEDFSINVYDLPTAQFSVSENEVCTGQLMDITYLGAASTAATYTWNFDGGDAQPGSGHGPHTISWSTSGTKTISLVVEESGCISELFSLTVDVSEGMTAPVINCGLNTTTSVSFNWNDVPGASGYTVGVFTGQTGTQAGNSFTVENIGPGEQVEIEVTALNPTPCPDVSATFICQTDDCPDFIFDFPPVADICRDAGTVPFDLMATVTGGYDNGSYTWSGGAITGASAGTFNPALAQIGANTVTLTYTEGPCSESEDFTINVYDVPSAQFSVSEDLICINQLIDISYLGGAVAGATYTWDFDGGDAQPGSGQGPHTVSWTTPGTKTISLVVEENGCTSEPVTLTVEVEIPLAEPVINCNSTPSTLEFSWNDVPGAESYLVDILTGQTGTQAGNTIVFSGLVPNEEVTIEIQAVSSGPCGNSIAQITCAAIECPDVVIQIDAVDPICFDASAGPIDLNAVITGGDGGGTETWNGLGITDQALGIFNPTIAGAATHTINFSYQEQSCLFNASIEIIVNPQPTADFTADGVICLTDNANVMYTGSASAGATYDWNFDSGQIISGADQGPYEIHWTTFGTKTISLIVTENDCASEIFTQEVTVIDTLQHPVVSCQAENTFITFSWENVPDATGYQVTGPAGDILGNTYTVNGLVPGEEVTITVIAESDGTCANSMTTFSCNAADCAPVSFDIPAIPALCPDDAPITVSATPLGGAGNGTFTFSGDGITDMNAGTFDPSLVTPGDITITIDYSEVTGLCLYDTFTVVTVNPEPVSAFDLAATLCTEEEATISFTGTASTGANYVWDFDGAAAIPGTGAGPHQLSWDSDGTKIVTLTVIENGCSSDVYSQEIVLDAPLAIPQISCEATTSSITFSWDAVEGAVDYQVGITDPAGTLSGTTYTVEGLDPGQEISIELTAIGTGECGNSIGQATCSAEDCPPLVATLSGPDAICIGSDATLSIDLSGLAPGPFSVVYTLNNGPEQTIDNVQDGHSITLPAPAETTTVEIVSLTDMSQSNCIYTGASWTVTVFNIPDAGSAATAPEFCEGSSEMVNLSDLLIAADSGGQWSETSQTPSSGSAFNAASGTFNTINQIAGVYTFSYFIDAPDPCPDAATEVSIIINPNPVANAGADQELNCLMGMATIGDNATTPGMDYFWTVSDPEVTISDPTAEFIDISQPGTYTLTVTNPVTGCIASDDVIVTANFEVPVAQISVTEISCFQSNDGIITVEDVSGGEPPYTYSLNGGTPSSQNFFTGLGPNTYSLVVTDNNGCFVELDFNLQEPDELVVTLITDIEGPEDNVLMLGESTRLSAIFNAETELDTILWQPDTLATGKQTSVEVSPATTTTYSVTIIDSKGCSDSDNLTLFVRKNLSVYIPNAFSPNGDGENDFFYIQAGSNVEKIKSFLVFNRWGETIIELMNFQPNDPTYSWDGTFRSQMMNAAVFTYFAEVEFKDGETLIFAGDVALMR